MSATIGLTDEDLERRRKGIGASDVAAILGVSPWRSPWDVWADKTGRLQPWEGNEATKIGQYLESSVLSYAEAQVGDLERNIRVERPGTPIVATLDARTIKEGIPVEVKTAGMTGPLHGDWGDAMTDHVPDHICSRCIRNCFAREPRWGGSLRCLVDVVSSSTRSCVPTLFAIA